MRRFTGSISSRVVLLTSALVVIAVVAAGLVSTLVAKGVVLAQVHSGLAAQGEQLADSLEQFETDAAVLGEALDNNYDDLIRSEVETVISILEHFDRQGGASAQAAAKSVIRDLKYGENGYFWIDNDEFMLQLLPPQPEKEGMYRKDLKDQNGFLFCEALIGNAIKDGSAYTDYWFPKPGSEEAFPKRGYTQYFEPWGWIPGTGNYVDDLEAEKAAFLAEAQSKFQETIASVSSDGVVLITDAEGNLLYHTDPERAGTSVDDGAAGLFASLTAHKDSDVSFRYPLNGRTAELIAHVKHLPESDRYVVLARDKAVVLGGIRRLNMLMGLLLVAAVALAAVGGSVIARQVASPVRETVAVLRGIAEGEGDLTQRLPESRITELGELSACFNQFVGQIQDIVKTAQESSSSVAAASQEVASSAQEQATGIQQMATVAETVATSASRQMAELGNVMEQVRAQGEAMSAVLRELGHMNEGLGQAGEVVGAMVDGLRAIDAASEDVGEAADAVRAAAEDGNQLVSQTNEGMERIRANAETATERVRALAQQSEQIDEMVGVINDVAEQTNLLALNAAIEAARAGEHGKGFAVVAEEVRKLAERSAQSSREIGSIVRDVRTSIDDVVALQEQGSDDAREGADLAARSSEALGRIVTAMRRATEGITRTRDAVGLALRDSDTVAESREAAASAAQLVGSQAGETARLAETIARLIEGVARISEDLAAASEEASASTQELSAGSEEIAAAAEETAASSSSLNEVVARFRT